MYLYSNESYRAVLQVSMSAGVFGGKTLEDQNKHSPLKVDPLRGEKKDEETAWECALREVMEESMQTIYPDPPLRLLSTKGRRGAYSTRFSCRRKKCQRKGRRN